MFYLDVVIIIVLIYLIYTYKSSNTFSYEYNLDTNTNDGHPDFYPGSSSMLYYSGLPTDKYDSDWSNLM